MKICDAAKAMGLETVCCPDPEKELKGGYCGDLLSWVMGRAKAGDMWITIMSNINVVAVATLTDVAGIVLAEGTEADEKLVETAQAKGVNIFRTQNAAFETAALLAPLLK